MEELPTADLSEDRAVIWDKNDANDVFSSGWYGDLKSGNLELALIEGALLLEKGKINIVKGKKKYQE